MGDAPGGTVTFLFTDLEGSTELVQRLGDQRYAEVLEAHRRLLREVIRECGGHELDTAGDAFFVAFARAADAAAAAAGIQRATMTHSWPAGAPPRVRVGVHTGQAIATGQAYVGLDVHRAARISGAGHGGQILLSQTTYELVRHGLPQGTGLRDLGEHRLKDLARAERIWQLLVPDLPDVNLPLRSLNSLPNNLPVQLTSFVGREREMAEVTQLVTSARLVTLTGTGGAGKTRLAVQVAGDVAEDFPDGVLLVELATLTEPDLLAQRVGAVLQLREERGRPVERLLLESVGSKRLLLILDNCEHLIDACARLTLRVLEAASRVTILATSRETLNVPGEVVYTVPPLSTPDPTGPQTPDVLTRSEAVVLFVDRAAARQFGFGLTAENGPAIAQLIRILDGIPLAIELAAARVPTLSVLQIVDRLQNRFQLLTTASRTAPLRQRTLQAALDWSYDLLSVDERVLFHRLSVFAGGGALEAVEEVCTGGAIAQQDVVDLLGRLVNKSLVRVTMNDGATRYGMLDTVCKYGRMRLAGSDEELRVGRRHRDWFLRFAEAAAQQINRAGDIELERIEVELDNIRGAFEFSLRHGDGPEALRLAVALWRFWMLRGYWTEGRSRLHAALESTPDAPRELRAQGLHAAGVLAEYQGDYGRARALSEESLAIRHTLEDKRGIAASLTTLGNIAYNQGDYTTAWQLHEESLAYGQDVGDRHSIAAALVNLAIVADHKGDFVRAAELCEQSLALFRDLQDRRGVAFVLSMLGVLRSDQGDFEAAKRYLEESLVTHRELKDKRGIATALGHLARVAREQGDLERARGLYEECLTIRQGLAHRAGIAAVLSDLAAVALRRNDPHRAAALWRESLAIRRTIGAQAGIAECLEGLAGTLADTPAAARLLGAAAALRETVGAPHTPAQRPAYERQLRDLRSALGGTVFEVAWNEGRGAPLDDILRSVLESFDV